MQRRLLYCEATHFVLLLEKVFYYSTTRQENHVACCSKSETGQHVHFVVFFHELIKTFCQNIRIYIIFMLQY